MAIRLKDKDEKKVLADAEKRKLNIRTPKIAESCDMLKKGISYPFDSSRKIQQEHSPIQVGCSKHLGDRLLDHDPIEQLHRWLHCLVNGFELCETIRLGTLFQGHTHHHNLERESVGEFGDYGYDTGEFIDLRWETNASQPGTQGTITLNDANLWKINLKT